MKIGVMLPNFETSVEPAMEFAASAEKLGLHGLFCYDHLWPMGHPGLPSLSAFPLLSAVSSITSRIALGTLVARVGLDPDEVLVAEFMTLDLLSKGRVIAAVGTGDHKSEDENLAFGLGQESAEERRTRLRTIVQQLMERGLVTWIGGGGPLTNAIARELGCTVNIWAGGADALNKVAAASSVSWGGQLPESPDLASTRLRALRDAGASWAVISWQGHLNNLVEAVNMAGIVLQR